MIAKTQRGYLFDGSPLTDYVSREEAARLEEIFRTMEKFSDDANSLLNEFSYDLCMDRGVIVPADEPPSP